MTTNTLLNAFFDKLVSALDADLKQTRAIIPHATKARNVLLSAKEQLQGLDLLNEAQNFCNVLGGVEISDVAQVQPANTSKEKSTTSEKEKNALRLRLEKEADKKRLDDALDAVKGIKKKTAAEVSEPTQADEPVSEPTQADEPVVLDNEHKETEEYLAEIAKAERPDFEKKLAEAKVDNKTMSAICKRLNLKVEKNTKAALIDALYNHYRTDASAESENDNEALLTLPTKKL